MRNNAYLVKEAQNGGAEFGAQWDINFVHPIRSAIITNEDAFRDMNAVRDALQFRYDQDAFCRVIYTESHDEVANGRARIPEEIWPGNVDSWFSKKRSTLGAALMLTAPGVPMLFQGQEFLADRWFEDQEPLNWQRAAAHGGILDMYRELIRLRRNLDGKTGGLCGQNLQVHHVHNENKLIAFHRWQEGSAGDSVIVVANMANTSREGYRIGLPAAGEWQVRFNSDWQGYDEKFGAVTTTTVSAEEGDYDGMTHNGAVNIGPYSVVILSQDQPT